MTVTIPNGRSKNFASRVFGRDIFNELDTSLCYTPSPGPSKTHKNLAGSTTKSNSKIFESIEEEESISESTPVPTILFQPDHSNNHNSFTRTTSKKKNSPPPQEKQNAIGSQSFNSIRNDELNRLRASNKKSPMRRNLVKLTKAAIDNATTSLKSSAKKKKKHPANKSVFQSINAGRTARSEVLAKKAKAKASVSFRWDQEKAKAKSLQKKVEENRRQIRAIQRKLTSHHFREKAEKDEAAKFERLAELEKECMFKSEVFQDQKKKLKQERDERRKKSIAFRNKMLADNREGEEIIRARKLEENQAMFEVREDLRRSRMEVKKANAEKRRKSFQFRSGDARRIRDMRCEWKGKAIRKKHESHELERAAARDVENYKKQMEKESQENTMKRNMEAYEARKREKETRYEAMLAEHRSYELKWEGERDEEAYRKRMKEERRKSLAARNRESARHAKVMEELRNIAIEDEVQSFMLKFQAENDAKEYVAKLAEERRKSLQLRGIEARRARHYEEEKRSKEIEARIMEGAIQSDCQKDVEKYKADCAERRRKSFQYRAKEDRLKRLVEEERRLEKMQMEEESYQLKALAQKDVENYYKDCRKARRKSLALRAKESRRHVEWKKRRAEKELEERSETTYLKSLDIHHMALERERERALKAMNALRNAGCNWKGNPFSDLLNDL